MNCTVLVLTGLLLLLVLILPSPAGVLSSEAFFFIKSLPLVPSSRRDWTRSCSRSITSLVLCRRRHHLHHAVVSSSSSSSADRSRSSSHNNRDINSLKAWAVNDAKIIMNPCISLCQDMRTGEWGVVALNNNNDHDHQQQQSSNTNAAAAAANTVLMTIPSQVILSSAKTKLSPNQIRTCQQSLGYHSKDNMQQYLPEFLLMIELLEQYSKGVSSQWYSWIQSLPRTFATGLWMTKHNHRKCLHRLAPAFVDHQNQQWEAFYRTWMDIRDDLDLNLVTSRNILDLDGHDASIIKWAFSVVFTRSWRTPPPGGDGGVHNAAVLVPVGDMFNHNSYLSNVQVDMTTTSSASTVDVVKIILQQQPKDPTIPLSNGGNNNNNNIIINNTNNLYLNYGITQYPERFLVMFGFCDMSCREVFLDITIPYDDGDISDNDNAAAAEKMGFGDFTQVTVSTVDGSLSQTAYDAVLYKVLIINKSDLDDDDIEIFRKAHGHQASGKDDGVAINKTIISMLHTKWEHEVREWIVSYARQKLDILESCQSDLDLERKHPAVISDNHNQQHHHHTAIIRQYCDFMIAVWNRVIERQLH